MDPAMLQPYPHVLVPGPKGLGVRPQGSPGGGGQHLQGMPQTVSGPFPDIDPLDL